MFNLFKSEMEYQFNSIVTLNSILGDYYKGRIGKVVKQLNDLDKCLLGLYAP